MLRLFLERLLVGPTGFTSAGVPVPLGAGDNRLLFARMTNALSDGDGHRQAWSWLGATSIHVCFKHINVLKKQSDLAHRSPNFVEISCSDFSKFCLWTAAELYQASDTLAEAAARVDRREMTKTLFKELEMTIGLKSNRSGVLQSSRLRCSAILTEPPRCGNSTARVKAMVPCKE